MPQLTLTKRQNRCRGGSWYYGSWDCRSAYRYDYAPDLVSDDIGFRVVYIASQKQAMASRTL